MLILTRKLNEKISIGGDIVITVSGIERDKVRLGIEAPPDVAILRAEAKKTSKALNSKTA